MLFMLGIFTRNKAFQKPMGHNQLIPNRISGNQPSLLIGIYEGPSGE